jgi:small subunit ribosomal protein S9
MSKIISVSGKRKRAIARAFLKEGKGEVKINNIPIEHFTPNVCRMKIMEPLILAGDVAKKVNITVNVMGGGISGQADAARLSVARALAKYSSALEPVFLEYDRNLLVADVRRNEPHKPNRSKPRAKRQKSYR